MSTVKNSSVQPDVQHGQTPADQITQKIPGRRPLKKKGDKAAVQKSAGAFRTISEVADELRVEQHVLRFWETKFSQIKPLKRGGGRRYYRPEDIELIKNIHHLLYQEGYTIKGVQKLLSSTRGNLSARVAGAAPAQNPLAKAVARNKDELQSMLEELKSMRKMIE
jgi:DNA-binding transcriptional MerR regulator